MNKDKFKNKLKVVSNAVISGKRKNASGEPVIKFMPSEQVVNIMHQVWEMGYRGAMNFHHLSEPFFDKRLIDFAITSKQIGFSNIIHTNGDILKTDKELARKASEVFDDITIGLYDYKSEEERIDTEAFWENYLTGVKELHFTRHEITFPRHNVDISNNRMSHLNEAIAEARPHPCELVREHLIIHYDGNIALCCEDVADQFEIGNAFETPIKDLWWSDRRKEVIDILSRPGGRLHFANCAECPYSPNIHKYTIAKAGTSVTENPNAFSPTMQKKQPATIFESIRKLFK